MTEPVILILGGTREAADLAERLTAAAPHARVISSLAGRTRSPAALAGEVRIGGFGGKEALSTYLAANKVTALIDATHPYADRISKNAHWAAERAGCPLLRLERAAWERVEGDRWITAESAKEAASLLRNMTVKRVLLTTGKKDLEAFKDLRGLRLLIRLVETPVLPEDYPEHELILARGPFKEEAEIRLLKEKKVEVLVSKNSGGEATYSKISAARVLGLPVVMIERPPQSGDCGEISVQGLLQRLSGLGVI
ncbi:MAG: cobalt-precorrin-6A reductase [Kiloniellales bacterium]|nr:cobalt-precorrin-6A reductase [Kiloniellales bacterium]